MPPSLSPSARVSFPIARGLLCKLNAQLAFPEGSAQFAYSSGKCMESAALPIHPGKPAEEEMPAAVLGVLIPLLWALGILGRESNMSPVKAELQPGVQLVKKDQSR